MLAGGEAVISGAFRHRNVAAISAWRNQPRNDHFLLTDKITFSSSLPLYRLFSSPLVGHLSAARLAIELLPHRHKRYRDHSFMI